MGKRKPTKRASAKKSTTRVGKDRSTARATKKSKKGARPAKAAQTPKRRKKKGPANATQTPARGAVKPAKRPRPAASAERSDSPRFFDYSGAPVILLPKSLARFWNGFYLPVEDDDEGLGGDLELPEGSFEICEEFDLANPRTDYDRLCAQQGQICLFPVGTGQALAVKTGHDRHGWWPERQMIVEGGALPEVEKMSRIDWSTPTEWRVADTDFVLMNACDHGADPDVRECTHIRLLPGRYEVTIGQYGWDGDEPYLHLVALVRAGD